MTRLSNTPYDALRVGMEARYERICIVDDLYVFANASGNLNPLHLPKEDGDGDGTPEALAPSLWLGALISAVLGNRLPGPGTLYQSQTLKFLGRAYTGDKVVAKVRVLEKLPGSVVRFKTWVERADGMLLVEGEAEVIAPQKQQSFEAADVPGLTVRDHEHFDRLLELARPLPPIPTSVVAPETAVALAGAILAAEQTLIVPILIGCQAKIEAAAAQINADLSGYEIINVPDHDAAAARAVALVHEGRARAVMKGDLHTDQLLRAILKREGGLRTSRRLSHVFVMDVPGLEHLLLVTDAAINIAPNLQTKVDIAQNAIYLALALGITEPKVGVLSAVETVTPSIPSTLDAAILSKMAERGQIKGGLVDGPLAMDNAVDLNAARTKGLTSLVAGRANILLAPNLEAGNMIAKELTFLAHALAGGLVMGAQVPVILTSRADDDKSRLASCAVAALYADWAARR
jgi:phosphotransacetylase/acyl dehydratase